MELPHTAQGRAEDLSARIVHQNNDPDLHNSGRENCISSNTCASQEELQPLSAAGASVPPPHQALPASPCWNDLDCSQSILAVLREVTPNRLTAEQIHAALVQRRKVCWGLSTVQRKLRDLVKQHLLVNRQDLLPKGYCLHRPARPDET
jgi:hypothetical protein